MIQICTYFIKFHETLHFKNPWLSIFINFAMKNNVIAAVRTHVICRGGRYPRSEVHRFDVPEEKVKWFVPFLEYAPPEYTYRFQRRQDWADPQLDDPYFKPNWNLQDGPVNRKSYEADYEIVNGFPMNPIGRTGIKGRGRLGRWGPNHAADPIVTRWKRNENGTILNSETSFLPIMQFVAIKRSDNGQWALPGGMVEAGETPATTAVREFQEEAANIFQMIGDQEKNVLFDRLSEFFHQREEWVFSGYVDDPRNTDNAWIETVALNFHDETGELIAKIPLRAGSDAVAVQWMDIDRNVKLYANHGDFIERVSEVKRANW